MSVRILISCIVVCIFATGCNQNGGNAGARDTLLPIKIDGKYGYANGAGETVVKPCYTMDIGSFSEGLATLPSNCNDNSNWGYINSKGDFVIKPQFTHALPFSEGLAAVQVADDWGFINTKGEFVVKPKYSTACNFSEGLACVKACEAQDGQYTCKYGYINQEGVEAIKPFTDSASDFSQGLAVVKIKGKYGFIDKTGNVKISANYDFSTLNFSEGLARIRTGEKFGYVDLHGNVVIKPSFNAAGSFSEGLAFAKLNNKFGFIDKSGNFIIPPKYDLVLDDIKFSKGLACVGIGNEQEESFFYIDRRSNKIIDDTFGWCSNFTNGIARVKKHGKMRYINKEGNIIWG